MLAPKLTEYAKMTEEQKQRTKREKRRIRDQKKNTEFKRKTEDAEALGRVQKARKELEHEVTDLKSVVTTMQQPVRGSVQYYAHEIAALKVKRAEDAKKIEEAVKKATNQAEAHKEQIKQLEDNFKKQTAAIKAQIRTAKTKHRQAQEEIVVKQEQHRTTLAAVTQDNADFYEDEVAQLNASLEVADLETKIMVDGKATREWDIDYWQGQMKSMMHTTPAVTLKLWDYAMNYVEATSAVKRSKNWSPPTRKHLAELRTDAGLVGQICAGVAVAKAKTLLTVMIDETELECSNMQSMITTIEDESGRVRSIALDGVTLLKKKTSEAAAEKTSDTFRSTSIILSHVHAAYVHRIMLWLAWLVWFALVVELCVSMVGCYRTGWHVLCRGTHIFL